MPSDAINHGGRREGSGRKPINGIGCERHSISIFKGDWDHWNAAAKIDGMTTSAWIRTLASKRTEQLSKQIAEQPTAPKSKGKKP